MTGIHIGAPMRGWVSGLDEVPDPVFAERMMGEGVAIDPLEGVLRAPCDAKVIAVAPTRHSVTIELANGALLLLHVGLETVALAGEGFVAHVRDGDAVEAGDKLIGFDLDLLARRAKSLITPIVVINEGYALRAVAVDRLVEAGEAMFEVSAVDMPVPSAGTGQGSAVQDIVVSLANGIHARPAARIVAALKPFSAEVSLAAYDRVANARSIVAMLGLGVSRGDRVRITGNGADAGSAVAVLAELIESGMGEAGHVPTVSATPQAASSGPILTGVCASPGCAIGPAAHWCVAALEVPEQGGDAASENAALERAMTALSEALSKTPRGPAAEIASAHLAMLDDPELLACALRRIGIGQSAGFAWRGATREWCNIIRETGDALLLERVDDLIDVERQLLARLTDAQIPSPIFPKGAILIAAELLPSQFMALNAADLGGICTARGGPTSHVAILAASAGVPMLVAVGEAVLAVPEGQSIILDADAGIIDMLPKLTALTSVAKRIENGGTSRAAEAAAAHEPCVTADGVRIEIMANLGSLADADTAMLAGAEGCGLLRTEFLFLDRPTAPDEEEQREVYARIAERLEGQPLIVRTLDIGGDKPVPYLSFAHEDNPALGLRGVRLSLARPDLLAVQFRAILRGVPLAQCRIMVPMIVDVGELRRVRSVLDDARAALGIDEPIPLGVMIETPAAALLAASIAAEADFLSIGSNDLTQYTLAVDRGNAALASRVDPLHPAVLRLVAEASKGARLHGKWLGVCGGVASDPLAAVVLIGLGVTELSATPASIPALKAAVRRLSTDACRSLAERALACESAQGVRTLLRGIA